MPLACLPYKTVFSISQCQALAVNLIFPACFQNTIALFFTSPPRTYFRAGARKAGDITWSNSRELPSLECHLLPENVLVATVQTGRSQQLKVLLEYSMGTKMLSFKSHTATLG